LVLGTLAAITMGLFISALVPNTNTVIYIILLALFFQIIFAGVIFELPPATKNLSYLTLSRWTVEGLGVSADIAGLNTFTRTRFQLDPITQEVSLEVEKPSEDWEPVTVVTETQEIVVPCPSGIDLTVPITVPQVTTHEMVTVTETITQEVTVEPEPVDVVNEQEFQVDYTHTVGHLWGDWLIMLGFGLLSGLGTVIVLKRKDVG